MDEDRELCGQLVVVRIFLFFFFTLRESCSHYRENHFLRGSRCGCRENIFSQGSCCREHFLARIMLLREFLLSRNLLLSREFSHENPAIVARKISREELGFVARNFLTRKPYFANFFQPYLNL